MILDTKIYYETVQQTKNYPEVVAHDTLKDAIKYAEEHNIKTIQEIGGSWTEYEKCWFCEEWFSTYELNTKNECSRCETAIKDHFDYLAYDRSGNRKVC